MDDLALDAFQRAMLDALRAGGEPDAVRARLLAADLPGDLAAWVAAWDDRAVRAAVSLTARWGRWDGR